MRFETPKTPRFDELIERERRRLAAKERRSRRRSARGRDGRKRSVYYTGPTAKKDSDR